MRLQRAGDARPLHRLLKLLRALGRQGKCRQPTNFLMTIRTLNLRLLS